MNLGMNKKKNYENIPDFDLFWPFISVGFYQKKLKGQI